MVFFKPKNAHNFLKDVRRKTAVLIDKTILAITDACIGKSRDETIWKFTFILLLIR